MRKVFVFCIVVIPLGLAIVSILNTTLSGTFPLLETAPTDELEYQQYVYDAGLEYCKNNYGNVDTVYKKEEYARCIDLVEKWHAEDQS